MSIGDVVRLKGDSTLNLTILQVGEDGTSVQVAWFSADKSYKTDWIATAALQLAYPASRSR